MGVAHGDDLQYIFNGIWGEDLQMSPSDTKFTRNIFTPLLANFAKTSVPTPAMTDHINVAWPPLAPGDGSRVLKIDSKLSLIKDHIMDRLRLQCTLVDQYEKKNNCVSGSGLRLSLESSRKRKRK